MSGTSDTMTRISNFCMRKFVIDGVNNTCIQVMLDKFRIRKRRFAQVRGGDEKDGATCWKRPIIRLGSIVGNVVKPVKFEIPEKSRAKFYLKYTI